MVIENQYIQTSLMVALSLFRGKDRGGPIYKSEVGLILWLAEWFAQRLLLPNMGDTWLVVWNMNFIFHTLGMS